jgi:hypothetical protein
MTVDIDCDINFPWHDVLLPFLTVRLIFVRRTTRLPSDEFVKLCPRDTADKFVCAIESLRPFLCAKLPPFTLTARSPSTRSFDY